MATDQAYVAGGASGDTCSSNSNAHRRYDLSDNAWVSMTAMNYTRFGAHCNENVGAGGYVDGYIWGSVYAGADKKGEKYDISGNSWSLMIDQVIGESGGHRPYAVGCIWFNGYRYDIANAGWVKPGIGGASFTVDGILYHNSYTVGSPIKLDPSDMVPVVFKEYPSNVGTGSIHVCEDGDYGFLFGGCDRTYPNPRTTFNQRYDTAGDTWAIRAAIGTAVAHGASFLITGLCHVTGGHRCSGPGTTDYHGRFDDAVNSWTTKTSHPVSGGGHRGFNALINFPPNAPTSLSASDT